MMLNCLVSSAQIQTAVGAARTLPFRLKRARSTAYLDVSLATQIRLESQLVGEAAMPPVYAHSNDLRRRRFLTDAGDIVQWQVQRNVGLDQPAVNPADGPREIREGIARTVPG